MYLRGMSVTKVHVQPLSYHQSKSIHDDQELTPLKDSGIRTKMLQ